VPEHPTDQQLRLPRKKRGGVRRATMFTLVILGSYGLLAYLVLPEFPAIP
jgi:hypothetical protein